jgi:hypothetical protein
LVVGVENKSGRSKGADRFDRTAGHGEREARLLRVAPFRGIGVDATGRRRPSIRLFKAWPR